MSKLSLGVRDGESLQIGEAKVTLWFKRGKGRRGRLVISAPPSLRIGRLEAAQGDQPGKVGQTSGCAGAPFGSAGA